MSKSIKSSIYKHPFTFLISKYKKENKGITTNRKKLLNDINQLNNQLENKMNDKILLTKDEILREIISKNDFTEQINEIETDIEEIKDVQKKIQVFEDNKFNYFAQQQDYLEDTKDKIEKLMNDKIDYVKQINILHKQIIKSLDTLKPQEEMKSKENLRSINKDLQLCLEINDNILLLNYLNHLNIHEFINDTIENSVLLKLLYELNNCLSSKQLKIKVTYILLSLNKLIQIKLPSKYKDLFIDIKNNFLIYDDLLNYPDIHLSILLILFNCETIIQSL